MSWFYFYAFIFSHFLSLGAEWVGEAAIPQGLPNKLIETNADLKYLRISLKFQMLLVKPVGKIELDPTVMFL